MEYDKYLDLFTDFNIILHNYCITECLGNKCTLTTKEITLHEDYIKELMNKYKIV